jgi:hypothetical protein
MKRHRRRKSRNKQIFFLIISIEVLLLISGFAYVQFRPMVVKAVTVEAGEKSVGIDEFLLYKNRKGSFITDVQDMLLNKPGIYEVQIKIGKRIHTSSLEIVDTVAPTATVVNQMALKGEILEAAAFVKDISDATNVTASFKTTPDSTKLGDQEVTIVLEDGGRNKVEKKAVLTVLDMKSSISVEAGSEMNITVEDFVNNENYEVAFLTDVSKLDLRKPTEHNIQIDVNGRTVTGTITVVDTTAPTATLGDTVVWYGDNPAAGSFVKDIKDASEVNVTYKEAPDFTKLGEQVATLLLEDGSGNKTEIPTTLNVMKDTKAPEIRGIADKTVYIGESVSYKKGVTVEDNKDKDLTFTVNSSKVNLKKEGTYTATYSAKDTAGNKTSKSITITVKKFTIAEETVNELCDEILDQITKSGMTNRDIAYEIYKWIKSHISYTGSSDKSDWLAEAYRGIKNGVGDCFTYYAVAQALLTRADIDNMRVTRVGGRTKHFWNLIDCGDGWYHFDSCPNKDHKPSFMLTDDEVAALTKERGNNYYTFDKSLYPATPKK